MMVHETSRQWTSPHPSIEIVRLCFVDTSNIIRTRLFPAKRFFSKIAENGQGITNALFSMPALYDALFNGEPTRELQVMPDPVFFKQLPYHPTHAVVFGNVMTTGKRVMPFPLDPRGFLQRMILQLESEFGLTLKCGFESEFCLFKKHAPPSSASPTAAVDEANGKPILRPLDTCIYAQMSALSNPTTVAILDTIVSTLEQMDITVEQIHPESAFGQFEVVTAYEDALRAVDGLVATRIIVKDVAEKVGECVATFAPKVYEGQAGTASHVHLSLWNQEGQNVFGGSAYGDGALKGLDDPDMMTGSMTETGKQFLAGVLNHLPALLAITTPSPMSFKRILPSYWSGAYQFWGVQNKEAPLRVSHDATHVELKALDATANPYLALGSILAVGMEGLRKKLELTAPLQRDPAGLSDAERARLNISRLPETADIALAVLKQDNILQNAMGKEMFENYLVVKEKEVAAISAMEPEVVKRLMIDRF